LASARGGVNAIREVPADRWDVEALYDADPDAAGKMVTKMGGFLDKVDGFDPVFFGIAPAKWPAWIRSTGWRWK
jgi:acyl transferase domain-containing protein